MKRIIVASVLGIAGLVGVCASSHAQGSVGFSNYSSSPYYPVVYGTTGQGVPVGLAGTGALGNVSVELGYFIGTFDVNSVFTLVPASITPINVALIAPPNGVGAPTTGYFNGPAVSIPGYAGGPISFEILATTSGYQGILKWTEASVSVLPSPADFFHALPGNTVLVPVPEPTTLALAGLGGLALMAFRRKQS